MKKLRTEDEIIESWSVVSEKPLVSICCLAFNHENYVEDALVGFLEQETNFSFEIIIHDDASIDGTREIINEYKKNYERIIKIIYQDENKYSKGLNPLFNYLFPMAKGEYVAVCEGDDYWVCKNKLQKQITLLKNTPTVGICFHGANIINYKSGVEKKTPIYQNKIYSLSEVISAGASLMPTASIVAKRILINDMPSFVKTSKVGDYFIQVCCAVNGAIYLDEHCSVYRMYTPNSWSTNVHSSSENFIGNTNSMFSSLHYLSLWLIEKNYSTKGMDWMRARLLIQHYSLALKSKSLRAAIYGLRHFRINILVKVMIIIGKLLNNRY